MPGFYFPEDSSFDADYKSASGKHGVPAWLLKGITAAESEFNPNSVLWEPSHRTTKQPGDTDASRGLMQVTQKTAIAMGWGGGNFDSLFTPAVSIEWGARVIAAAMKNPYWKLDGGRPGPSTVVPNRPIIEKAIATYNMGYPRSIKSTTQFIADIYKYPIAFKTDTPAGWYFANQPYINMVMEFSAMYKALEENNLPRANTIRDSIKKKEVAAGRPGAWSSWRVWGPVLFSLDLGY